MGAWALTVLAALLVLLALTTPNQAPRRSSPAAFVRLPLEALVFLAVVLALPPSLGRVRTTLAVVAGIVLGLSVVLKLLDIGFLQALDRPFDALIDWRYAGSLVETRAGLGRQRARHDAARRRRAWLPWRSWCLLPLALLRLTRVAARHRATGVAAWWRRSRPSGWSWPC